MNIVDYNILKNASNDLMILMASTKDKVINPKLIFKSIYDNDATLINGNKTYVFKNINPAVKELLYNSDEILIVETDNGSVIKEYSAMVVNQ